MGLRCRDRRGPDLLVLLVLGLFVLGCSLAAAPATARPLGDIFTITGVAVDAEAETATAARKLALAEGQRRALRRLLRRLTLRADYSRHPEPDDVTLTALVRGIEIEDEKTSSTRYLAKLAISFKKDEVRSLLRRQGLRFSETPRKPLLVLPVYEAAGTQALWDDPNPWREAWLAREPNERGDSLVPLLVPEGTLADMSVIGPAQALAGDGVRLAAIAERYGIEDTMVARAELSFDLAAGAPRVEVGLIQFGPSGRRVVIENFVGVSREAIDQLLARAVREIIHELEEGWKRQTMLQFDHETRLEARVPLVSLGEWLEVRQRLGAVALVRKIVLDSLSKANAEIVVHYLGDPGQLSLSLAQRDLQLAQEDGLWVLRLRRASARPSTATRPPVASE